MLFALMLLGFVFGKENPRSGREGSLVTGVLIYIFYLSVLVAFRESYSAELAAFYYFLWPILAGLGPVVGIDGSLNTYDGSLRHEYKQSYRKGH